MSPVIESTLVLPFLKVTYAVRTHGTLVFNCHTVRRPMACVKCAARCDSIYDQRLVKLKDQKIRNLNVVLKIWKKRYFCPQCKRPRTEPVDGVLPGRRTTQRFRRWVMQMASQYSSLEAVCREAKVSRDFAYRAFYEQLDLESRKNRYAWPTTIGIDEHSFKKHPDYGGTAFASMIVDHKNKRTMEVVEGKTSAALESQLAYIPGRENVKWASLDLCDPFKKFCKTFFPNAKLVADPFHVLRLLTPEINKKRKEITGDKRSLKVRRLLLRSRKRLRYEDRTELDQFLSFHPQLEELYHWKERLHEFYRIRGYDRARLALKYMLDEMARSRSVAVLRLRKTLQKWANEILNHFHNRLTNARVEGFNNVAKTIKKRAYGFRSFKNYRLRVLQACS
jgi:transposase